MTKIKTKTLPKVKQHLEIPSPRTAISNAKELDVLRKRVLELEEQFSAPDIAVPTKKSTALPPIEKSDEIPKLVVNHRQIRIATHLGHAHEKDQIELDQEDRAGSAPHSSRTVEKRDNPIKKSPIKIVIDSNGKAKAAASQRQLLYNIIRSLHCDDMLTEDDIILLKKMVDAEFTDVIRTLHKIEHETNKETIRLRLARLLESGSPSKIKVMFSRNNPNVVFDTKIKYPLQKIAESIKQLGKQPPGTQVIVLVASGAYNPVHMLHIRALYLARQFIEANTKFPVVGGIISPCHDTFVRVKSRRTPKQMIPAKHRLAMLEAATLNSSWVEVDKWEITRRRVLDYLSCLAHVREICESQFPDYSFKLVYVCGCNTVVKLSHAALKEENFGCLVVCRPSQTDMVKKHLGPRWSKAVHIVEDLGVISCELEAATSMRVRNLLVAGASVTGMVGMHVAQYMKRHRIAEKVGGIEKWSAEDRSWRDEDKCFVEYL